MYARVILLILLVVVVAAVLYFVIARKKIGGADLSNKSGVDLSNKSGVDLSSKSGVDLSNKSGVDLSNKSGVDLSNKSGGDARGTILCIPGLGNGAESFDWPRVSPEIPDKIGVHSTRSLRDELTALGWDVRTFDQPDDPGATIADYCNWIEQNVMRGDRSDIVMGHSAGAHVANYYAATRHARAVILLDPTPKFIYDSLRGYKRHLDNPAEPKFAKTARYLWMYTENPAQNLFNTRADGTERMLIWSDDDADPRAAEKPAAMEAIAAVTHTRIKNATHWVHVTHPDEVLAAVSRA